MQPAMSLMQLKDTGHKKMYRPVRDDPAYYT